MSENQSETIELETIQSTSSSKIIAVGATLSAVYAIAVALPMSQFIGPAGSGSILSFAICIAPLFGLILGPAISGLLTGLCLQPITEFRGIKVPGPILTSVYLISVILLYLLPLYDAWWFILPYVLAAFVAIGLQAFKFRFDSTVSFSRIPLQILPLTLIGSLTDFSMMTLGSVYILELSAFLFGTVIFPVMLLERTASVIISAIIAGVLFTAFRNELFLEA